jgi:hypothetical protein
LKLGDVFGESIRHGLIFREAGAERPAGGVSTGPATSSFPRPGHDATRAWDVAARMPDTWWTCGFGDFSDRGPLARRVDGPDIVNREAGHRTMRRLGEPRSVRLGGPRTGVPVRAIPHMSSADQMSSPHMSERGHVLHARQSGNVRVSITMLDLAPCAREIGPTVNP